MRSLVLAALLGTTGVAFAGSGLSYNHIGLSYLQSEIESVDGDGFGLNGAIQITDHVIGLLDYNQRDLESNGAELNIDFLTIGFGGHYPVADNISLFGAVSYEELSADGSGQGTANPGNGDGGDGGDDGDGGGGGGGGAPSCDDFGPLGALFGPLGICDTDAKALTSGDATDGYGAQIGVRALVLNNIEVGARYHYRDYSDLDDAESLLSLGAGYRTGAWAFALTYDSYQELELEEFLATVRYDFSTTGFTKIW